MPLGSVIYFLFQAVLNIFYVFEEDFRENCVENKAIFGTNYSIA